MTPPESKKAKLEMYGSDRKEAVGAAAAMLDFFEAQRDWSYLTFGPRSFKGPKGPLDHLKKEAAEAHDETDPTKQKEEIIDCLFLVFDAAHRAGMSFGEMAEIAEKKLAKNKARTWPDWRGTDPDKAIEHVRETQIWLTPLDERTPSMCAEAHGTKATSTKPHDTGDPKNPCRCIIVNGVLPKEGQ